MAVTLAFVAISMLAYAVKAATGFGPALVIVSLGSLVVGPLNAVILAALFDVVGGLAVMWTDRKRRARVQWVALALAMSLGAVAGGMLLPVVPTSLLRHTVGAAVLGFGLWMLLAAVAGRRSPEPRAARRSRPLEAGLAAVAGVSGGLIGLGGPPLIIYFGPRLSRPAFRALLVPVLLAAAVTRVATYGLTGQISREALLLLAISAPVLPLGVVLGDRLFRRWSEPAFQAAVALLIAIAGLRLLL
jgi:uncharacterized protein